MQPMNLENEMSSIAIDKVITDNTAFGTAPLVPEIRIRLLQESSPLWKPFGDDQDAASEPRPYWAFAWGGGQALARYILDNPHLVGSRRVLDFGAGCGLASIAAAKAGATRVTAADIDQFSIGAIVLNARENEVEVGTLCQDLIYAENLGWDVILAGDIWYDSRVFRHGLNWLRYLASRKVVVLTGDPGRHLSPSKDLELLATYACRSLPDIDHPNIRSAAVYRILPKAG
jgi:predicted nicotinamide N-methyase